MPIEWSIVGTVIFIRITGYGAYGLRAAVLQILVSRLFKPSMSVLLDRSGATDDPSTDELRQRAQFLKMLLTRRNASRCALVVASRPQDLGLGRRLRIFLQSEGILAEVFTDADDAKAWLLLRATSA